LKPNLNRIALLFFGKIFIEDLSKISKKFSEETL